MTKLDTLIQKVHTLALFRNIFQDKVLGRFIYMLDEVLSQNLRHALNAYAECINRLYAYGGNISDCVLRFTQTDENPYLTSILQGRPIPANMQECLYSELDVLQELSRVASTDIKRLIAYEGFLPDWQVAEYDFTEEYDGFIRNIDKNGYGMFARYAMFTLEEAGPAPVEHSDRVILSSLYGYERQRSELQANTLALLEGKPAANALLYGDSGTGKSSTVKALVNEYRMRGLRLVEIRRTQLYRLPELIGQLADNPLKFILFIDDLAFTGEGDDFMTLKAVLEGSVLTRSKNIAVYATSNRRRMISESFSERGGDDVHANETIQQKTSLSDRFGLTLPFFAPNRGQYLDIVGNVARESGMEPTEDLLEQAEAFALQKGGRSPRAARQFIDQLLVATGTDVSFPPWL